MIGEDRPEVADSSWLVVLEQEQRVENGRVGTGLPLGAFEPFLGSYAHGQDVSLLCHLTISYSQRKMHIMRLNYVK